MRGAPVERVTAGQFARRFGLALLLVVLPVLGAGALAAIAAKFLGIAPDVPRWLVIAIAAVVGYRYYVRRTEQRPPLELAGPGAWRETGAGLLMGAGLFVAVMAVLFAAGAYGITGRGKLADVATVLVMSLSVGVVEEIVMRGILYRLVEALAGTVVAVVVSAAIFGALHFGSPNASVTGLVAIAVEAGTLLAFAYVLTRRLWFAIGIHAAWNFVQGGIFGVAVSGVKLEGWFTGTLTGPDWLTGGPFGPEASVVSVVVCTAAAAAIGWRAWRAGQFAPLRSRAARVQDATLG